jgi:hypothetical protein
MQKMHGSYDLTSCGFYVADLSGETNQSESPKKCIAENAYQPFD